MLQDRTENRHSLSLHLASQHRASGALDSVRCAPAAHRRLQAAVRRFAAMPPTNRKALPHIPAVLRWTRLRTLLVGRGDAPATPWGASARGAAMHYGSHRCPSVHMRIILSILAPLTSTGSIYRRSQAMRPASTPHRATPRRSNVFPSVRVPYQRHSVHGMSSVTTERSISAWKSGTPVKRASQFFRTGACPLKRRSGCAG
jgi:hypothetical protein